MGAWGMALTSSTDSKVHGRLLGGANQCLELHPEAWMYDSWCVLPYQHVEEHQYNRAPSKEPKPSIPWAWEVQ